MANRQYFVNPSGKLVLNRSFFKNIACGAVLFIIFHSCEGNIYAQVRVTGHIFAEIVEPTALSATANNSHIIETTDSTYNNELVIAEVKLSGGLNLNIDVAVKTSHLVAANGETLLFDAFVCPGCSEDNGNYIAGDKLFTLKATHGESNRQKKNSTYNGRYSVMFMYN